MIGEKDEKTKKMSPKRRQSSKMVHPTMYDGVCIGRLYCYYTNSSIVQNELLILNIIDTAHLVSEVLMLCYDEVDKQKLIYLSNIYTSNCPLSLKFEQ